MENSYQNDVMHIVEKLHACLWLPERLQSYLPWWIFMTFLRERSGMVSGKKIGSCISNS